MFAEVRNTPPEVDDGNEPLVQLPRDEFLRRHIPEWESNEPASLERSATEVFEQVQRDGIDVLAYYKTFRNDGKWGIFVRRAGVRGLGFHIQQDTGIDLRRCIKAAFRALYEHELLHFQVDCGFLKLESTETHPSRHLPLNHPNRDYIMSRMIHPHWSRLEEALANACALREAKREFRSALTSFFLACPPGYNDFKRFKSKEMFQRGLDGLFNFSDTNIDRTVMTSGIGRLVDLNDKTLNGLHVPVYFTLD